LYLGTLHGIIIGIGCFVIFNTNNEQQQPMPISLNISDIINEVKIIEPKDPSEFVVPTLLSEQTILCLVQNSYFEARNQDDNAVMSITMVVMNRMEHNSYPSNICDVIHQGYSDSAGNMILNKCQFSWYCDGKADMMTNINSRKRMEGLVYKSLWLWYNGVDITNGSTHYHTTTVNPNWSNTLLYTMQIGDHKFYKRDNI